MARASDVLSDDSWDEGAQREFWKRLKLKRHRQLEMLRAKSRALLRSGDPARMDAAVALLREPDLLPNELCMAFF